MAVSSSNECVSSSKGILKKKATIKGTQRQSDRVTCGWVMAGFVARYLLGGRFGVTVVVVWRCG